MSSLTPEERSRVEAEITTQYIQKGQFVCCSGDPAMCWIGVVDGLIKVCVSRPDGRMMTHIALAAGGWWGDAALQRGEPCGGHDVIALRHSVIACVPRATFLWLQGRSLRFNQHLLRLMAERMFYCFSLREIDRLHSPTDRVALCLVALLDSRLQAGIGTNIRISQEEIGDLVGLSRQRVNRALKALRGSGLLNFECRGGTVLDVGGLHRFYESNAHVLRHGQRTRANRSGYHRHEVAGSDQAMQKPPRARAP